jgi:hypothetical protein
VIGFSKIQSVPAGVPSIIFTYYENSLNYLKKRKNKKNALGFGSSPTKRTKIKQRSVAHVPVIGFLKKPKCSSRSPSIIFTYYENSLNNLKKRKSK